jgi:hypothetical protein
MKSGRLETCKPKGANTLFVEKRNIYGTKASPRQQSNGDKAKAENGTTVLFTLDRPKAEIVYLCGDYRPLGRACDRPALVRELVNISRRAIRRPGAFTPPFRQICELGRKAMTRKS